jgi:hypothetical protein
MQVKQFSGYDHDSSVEMKYLVDMGLEGIEIIERQ